MASVISRRWRGKGNWQEKARNQNVWDDVLVWDANDLEDWLETSATTSLWMASKIGIAGSGIASIETYEDIAKSFEHQARRHDDDARWTQES